MIAHTRRPKHPKMSKPHHLHVSSGADCCDNCAWYHPDTTAEDIGHCAMFGGYPVTAHEVCDSWEAGKPGSK